MFFEVTRTSYWGNNKCPYKKCIPIKLTRRVNNQGFITRDREEQDTYGIEINSIEELMNFFNEINEEIVLRKSWLDEKTPCLEIYDDYRE